AKSITKNESEDSSSSVVTETSKATSHVTSRAKSVAESSKDQSEQNPTSPMIAKDQEGLKCTLLPLDDNMRTGGNAMMSENEGLRTARMPSPVREREIVERRHIERILTEDEADTNKVAVEKVTVESGQVQQGETVAVRHFHFSSSFLMAEQEALLASLPPLPPLGALVSKLT
ncbi:hypothetical protein ANCCAN_23566, partial [Ancylostoma caninum]